MWLLFLLLIHTLEMMIRQPSSVERETINRKEKEKLQELLGSPLLFYTLSSPEQISVSLSSWSLCSLWSSDSLWLQGCFPLYAMPISFPKKVMHKSIICPCIKSHHIDIGIFLLSGITCVFLRSIWLPSMLPPNTGFFSHISSRGSIFLILSVLSICFWQQWKRQLWAESSGHTV